MRLAIAQLNTVVGDVDGNLDLVLSALARVHGSDVDLVVFPELALVGYPPGDLLERPSLAAAVRASLARVIEATPAGTAVIVGGMDWPAHSAQPRNVAYLIRDGRVDTVVKRLLPSYDVFDEARHFCAHRGRQTAVFDIAGVPCGISLCEDMWNDVELVGETRRYDEDPIEDLVEDGAKLLLNISASPYNAGKLGIRAAVVRNAARRHRVGVAMCNLVGGNDSLVFDGASTLTNPGGELVGMARVFETDYLVATWQPGQGFTEVPEQARARARSVREAPLVPPPCHVELEPESLDEIEQALELGLRDYVGKLGFERVVLGLSGGIDSTLTAYLAMRALGGDRVLAVEMPSQFTSPLSRRIGATVVENLGLRHRVLPIGGPVDAFVRELAPAFEGRAPDETEENIQARVRGTLLMALSNKFGHMVLSTGNKSEMAVGYCTLYGDLSGGLAVISDLFKLQVYAMCRRINQREGREVIPRTVIERPPSAELRADQTDQDSLPPYEQLDPVLVGILEDRLEDSEISEKTGAALDVVSRVRNMVDRAEFKRQQAPPTLRVSRKAWHGRRYPIVQRYLRSDSRGPAGGLD